MLNIALFWKPAVEILILWFLVYQIMLFFAGSRAVQVLRGIVILLFAFFLFANLGFEIIDWLFTKLFAVSIIALMIIFHPEIRQGLARLGRRHIFGASLRQEEFESALNEIGKVCETLSKDKIGALIAIENKDSLSSYAQSGVLIDSRTTSELIETIFCRTSILHDGGLIIRHGRIEAAGCIFPLTENPDLSRIFGTRHRAALGLSEVTDAIIIIVSEERQDVSLVFKGKMYKDLSREELQAKVRDFIKND